MSNKLVVYFSASGETEVLAKKLAQFTGADIFEIEPETRYTKEDLNWMDTTSRSSIEMGDKVYRPAIVKKELDLCAYDTVFLGFPIWWYVAPTIVNTFLETYDFAGKKVVLFATSGESGFGDTIAELQPSAPKTEFLESKVFHGRFSDTDIKEIAGLG